MSPVGQRVTLERDRPGCGAQSFVAEVVEVSRSGRTACLQLGVDAGGCSFVNVDTRTARPARGERTLSDPGAWRVAPADAARLGWGTDPDNPRLLPTWKHSGYGGRELVPNPHPPDAVCAACGHPSRLHGEHLPAPCQHGQGPRPLAVNTVADLNRVMAAMARGCQCTGFKPTAASP